MSTERLGELTALCAQLRDAERAEVEADEALKRAKATTRRIAEEDIPGLMSELGVEKITLDTGETVSVGLEVYAGITKANQEAAYKWLEENGFGSLIDTNVNVHFSRAEKDKVAPFMEQLAAMGFTGEPSMGVHHSRLKSFLKERLEAGAQVPLELFGARPVNTAKIKAAKQRA